MKHYGHRGGGVIGRTLATLPGKLISHWLFQSLTYMDQSERVFKVGLDIVITALVAAVLQRRMSAPAAAVVGWLVAHTVNFVVNSHIRGVLKWHRPAPSLEAATVELERVSERLCRNPAIRQVLIYGSFSKSLDRRPSDLDLRVLRRGGVGHALRACVAVLVERTRNLAAPIAIDIYVWDSWRPSHQMNERPHSLCESHSQAAGAADQPILDRPQ